MISITELMDINNQTHDINNRTHDNNRWTHDINHWTHDINHWTHDINHWTHDINHLTHDINHWTHDINHSTHDINQCFDPCLALTSPYCDPWSLHGVATISSSSNKDDQLMTADRESQITNSIHHIYYLGVFFNNIHELISRIPTNRKSIPDSSFKTP